MCLISTIRVLPVIAGLLLTTAIYGQSVASRNNPYTPSPSSAGRDTIASVSYNRIEKPRISTLPAETQVYKVGPGDVLFINLTNSLNGKGYYSVLQEGTIDFGLSGERIMVNGKTPDDIARILESRISLYRNPRVEVRVREFASHNVIVSGLVSNGGRLYIQREAVPLFVIRATAEVNPRATKVTVRSMIRGTVTTYDLRAATTDDILIRAGDDIEFTRS